jgi:hypothetical protein
MSIRVALHVTESRKRGVRWTCSDHPAARGFHPFTCWTDHIRPGRRPSAWMRAHNSARLHHHVYHQERSP